jgi:hypothetical protein
MEAQDPLGSGPLVRISLEMVRYVDAPHDQDLVLCLNLANDICRQIPLSGGNPARLQRATKGPRQSASRRRNEIVYRRSMRRVYARIHAIVFGYLVMHSE